MSIVEKLGIKINPDGAHQFFCEEIYKSVKEAAPEMLEALIAIYEVEELSMEAQLEIQLVCEKATGKTWSEIKELL